MGDNGGQDYLPKRLVQYLVYLWISLINVGMDFGFLLKATRSFGVLILLVLFTVSILLSIYWTKALVDLFREHGPAAVPAETPEIV